MICRYCLWKTEDDQEFRTHVGKQHSGAAAFKNVIRLTENQGCPACGGEVMVSRYVKTGVQTTAFCQSCDARWYVHNGMPVEIEMETLAEPEFERLPTAVYDPWSVVNLLLDGGDLEFAE